MARTHVILDGLQDPLLAQDLSKRWASAGLWNQIDVAGQCGWIEEEGQGPGAEGQGGFEQSEQKAVVDATLPQPLPKREGSQAASPAANDNPQSAIRNPQSDDSGLRARDSGLASAIARAFGIELRDRVGLTFKPDNDLAALRSEMTREYRTRFAQALMFGLPAILLHYLGPMLASGGGQSASSMAFPWLFEMVLSCWAMWVGGSVFLWQGGLSLLHLRMTADLFISLSMLAATLPSLLGVASLLWADQPWFGVPVDGQGQRIIGAGPAFHVAMMLVLVALAQRWLLHSHIARLAGRGSFMLRRFSILLNAWLIASILVMLAIGWHAGLALALVLPPMLSLGAINRWSPGWSIAMIPIAFGVLLVSPLGAKLAPRIGEVRFEVAAAFAWMMTIIFAAGWRRLVPLVAKPQAAE